MASSAGNRLTREQFKKQRELEELRKSGVAPAALDEDGKMINPHIPNYISQAPWYLNAAHPSLKHQKADSLPADSDIHRYRRRGLVGQVAKGYRKGACENCGAISHKAKDCVERPRRRGAALTNKNICPDEIVEQVDLSYDGKRDRWNGYDPSMYQEVIDHFQRTDEARLARKTAELEQAPLTGAKSDASSDSDSDREGSMSDEADDLKDTGVVIQKRDARTRTTVRNLRIREDRAKYLINLDVNSAYYDSKSRSMRENPHPNATPDEVAYAGDNFVRASGDIRNFTELASFAWEAEQKGDPDLTIHPTAAPSQAEMLFKVHKQKKEEAAKIKKQTILGKYGGEEYVREKAPVVAQSELYAEYSADGKLLKGAQPAKKRSKYHEDIHERGHTSVYGSYFQDNRWGYQCCRQTYRNAYCTGPIAKESSPVPSPSSQLATSTVQRPELGMPAAIVTPSRLLKTDEPSESEIEEYRRNRERQSDPMADFIKSKKSKKS